MYTFHTDIDETAYDTFVENHVLGNLLQSSQWARIKTDWESMRTGVYDANNQLIGAALILIRSVKGLKFGYIPRGPVMDYHNEALVAFYIQSLKQLAKKQGWLFVKCDPKIIRRMASSKLLDETPVEPDSEAIVARLEQNGAKHQGYTMSLSETIQPRFEAIVDVEEFDEKKLSSKVRNCINGARNRGVYTQSYNHEGAELLEQVIQKTMARKGITLRGADYFGLISQTYGNRAEITMAQLNVLEIIAQLEQSFGEISHQILDETVSNKQKKQLEDTKASLEKRLLALKDMPKVDTAYISGGLSVAFAGTLEQIYAGFDDGYKNFYPQFLLYVSFIDCAKQKGCSRVNLGGVENNLDGGLIKFKDNFNPIIEEYVGEFDIVVSPLYHLMQLGIKLRKKLRKIRG